jgi:nucleotide-binding universal stress UspA family protein
MIEITDILCPIDFSEFSRRALDYAVAIARWYGSRVTALHVYTTWPVVDVLPVPAVGSLRPKALADANSAELVQRLRAFIDQHPAGDVQIEAQVHEAADVYRGILARADALDADLIVIGSHGRSGFERLLIGSTTEKVLRKAHCPVMVVPRRFEGEPGGAAHFKRILCAVDFSGSSTDALSSAISLAQEAQAELTVLHVVEIPTGMYEPAGFDVAAFQRATEVASGARLRELIPRDVQTSCTVDTVISEGRAWHEILRVAADRRIDLIVMGVRGRGALNLMVFGSNTHHVIRSAACPVLVIHGPAGAG